MAIILSEESFGFCSHIKLLENWSQLSLTLSLIYLLAVPVLDIITELVFFVQTAVTVFFLDGILLRKSSVSSTTDHSFIVLTTFVIELGITVF